MKIRVIFMLLLAGFARLGHAQTCLDSVRTYELPYPEFNYIVTVSEACDGERMRIILKNTRSQRIDTLHNGIPRKGSVLMSPLKLPHFGFIDSVHFVMIRESYFPSSYPVMYGLFTIIPTGFEQCCFDTIITYQSKTGKIYPNQALGNLSREGRYDYQVIDLTHIKILDRGKPVALLYFDLEQKKLIRTEIKATKKIKKRGQ